MVLAVSLYVACVGFSSLASWFKHSNKSRRAYTGYPERPLQDWWGDSQIASPIGETTWISISCLWMRVFKSGISWVVDPGAAILDQSTSSKWYITINVWIKASIAICHPSFPSSTRIYSSKSIALCATGDGKYPCWVSFWIFFQAEFENCKMFWVSQDSMLMRCVLCLKASFWRLDTLHQVYLSSLRNSSAEAGFKAPTPTVEWATELVSDRTTSMVI